MTSIKPSSVLLVLITTLFLVIFIIKSFITMVNVPFYDFDEAHRAENAKRMKEYRSFFTPLTGSAFDRVVNLRVPFKENPDLFLYYHLERPPLIYNLMILSTSIFGSTEWVYRIPSFLLGLLTIGAVVFLSGKLSVKKNYDALFVAVLAIITSSDLWLSSQYAQMDTGITLFLTLSLLTLLLFVNRKRNLLIYLSGIFFGLGILSKGQPAVTFSLPLIYLLIAKKINFKDLFKFILATVVTVSPWIIALIVKFGIKDVSHIFPMFAITSASIVEIHHKAPVFWYLRWWWESFRPGWTIFLALLIYDIKSKNFTWQKKTLLSYILGGLIIFSIPINKLWWYILPLIPAVVVYIYLSAKDYLEKNSTRLINLSLVIIIASLPIFLQTTNKVAILYGISITLIATLILFPKIEFIKKYMMEIIFTLSIIIGLLSFYNHFPKIIPYHWNTKFVAQYYDSLPGKKCLWLGDMPGEAALFYSNAGEIIPLREDPQFFADCQNNYLITPEEYDKGQLIIRKGNMRLYKLPNQ